MSFGSYSTHNSEKKSTRQRPSKVLLVCVYQTVIFQLTNQTIYQKFCQYGPIIKILIFQKGQVTKFFVEFSQFQNALNAKQSLDGTKFFENICKMNIFFSNFNSVDLKHESSEGANFQMIQQRRDAFLQNFDKLTKSSQQHHVNFLDDYTLWQPLSTQGFGGFSRSKTDNPRSLNAQIIKMQQQQKFNIIEEEQVDKDIKNQIHSLLTQEKSQQSLKNSQSMKNLNSNLSNSSPSYQPNQKKINVQLKSEHNLINNCTISYELRQYVPLRQIYNLFSNFGNIQCVASKKERVYIKFRSGYFAAVAMNYLINAYFIGNILQLKYCEDPYQYLPKQNQYCQSIQFDDSYDRFTPKRSITVNPPSQTLHVSSIRRQNCNQGSLKKIFSQYGSVQRVKILMQTNQKNMALVKFSSIKASFEAISQLHNKAFGGRKIQISFTKSKL